MAELETLVEDIFSLFDPNKHHQPNEDNLDLFCNDIKSLLRTRLAVKEERPNGLRFSSLGRPDRQIYLDSKGVDKEEMSAKTFYKFLYGDIIEQLVLFLAREAGHSVESQQLEVEVDGVLGHIDAIIDGVVVDVKSASPIGFEKIVRGKVFEDDPFGYVQQLAGYTDVLTPGRAGAWLPVNKVNGDIAITLLPTSVVEQNKPGPRITHLKEMLKNDVLPRQCYPTVDDGKSGNQKLATGCSYCGHKKTCFPNARLFLYSSGPRYLTTVVKTPEVVEITNW